MTNPTPATRLADDAPMLGGQTPITGREPMLGGDRRIELPPETNYLDMLNRIPLRDRMRLMMGYWEPVNTLPPDRPSPYSGGINP